MELGFLEKVEYPEELNTSSFPSKVGGKPVWLDQSNIPSPQEIACIVCGKQKVFLLQIYAPLPDTPDAFHRTFFLFMCSNSSCHQKNDARGFAVFRYQLPKTSSFDKSSDEQVTGCAEGNGATDPSATGREGTYSGTVEGQSNGTEPSHRRCDAAEGGHVEALDSSGKVSIENALEQVRVRVGDGDVAHAVGTAAPLPLCIVCGCSGPKKCSKCKVAHYCSRDHQTHDWRNGHKLFCSDLSTGRCELSELSYDPSYGLILPEFEIVTEDEPEIKKQPLERSEEERMKEYYRFVQSEKYQNRGKYQERKTKTVLEKAEREEKHDKTFKAFKQRIAVEPEQVRQVGAGMVL